MVDVMKAFHPGKETVSLFAKDTKGGQCLIQSDSFMADGRREPDLWVLRIIELYSVFGKARSRVVVADENGTRGFSVTETPEELIEALKAHAQDPDDLPKVHRGIMAPLF